MTIRTVWVAASLALAGCGQAGIAALAAAEQPALKCQCYGCPCYDRALIQGMVADTEATQGPAPGGNFQIKRVTGPSGDPLGLHVTRDQLTAVSFEPPFPVFKGLDLQGVTISLVDAKNETFDVTISQVWPQSLHLWEGAADAVEAYELSYLRVDPPDPNGTPAYVCSGQGTSGDPLWGGVPHAATFFEGDFIDLDHVKVSPPPPGMFHIGCAGSTHARMHLSRHTQASNHDGHFPTTLDQRNAMLKMFSADYCGTAQTLATDNFPLRWLDNTGWAQPPLDLDPKHGQITSIEAIWGPNGAVCLDTPRQIPRAQVPCALPPCGNVAGWASRGHVISANPVLP